MPKCALHIGHKYAKTSFKHNSRENPKHPNVFNDFSRFNSCNLLGLDNSEQATQERLDALYSLASSNFEKALRKNPKNKIIRKGKNAGKPNGFQHFTPKKHATKEMILELPQIEIKKGDDPKKLKMIYDKIAENCAKEICELFKIKAIQFTIHRDEGYLCDKDKNTLKCHQHAHLVAFTLDEQTGYQRNRKGQSKKKEFALNLGHYDNNFLKKDKYATFSAANLSKAQEIVYKHFGHFENVEKQERTFGVKGKKAKNYNKDYRNYKAKKKKEQEQKRINELLGYSRLENNQNKTTQSTSIKASDALNKLLKETINYEKNEQKEQNKNKTLIKMK